MGPTEDSQFLKTENDFGTEKRSAATLAEAAFGNSKSLFIL